ncbi:MAG: hypothetical protein KTR31_25400 [Myxococcales bacterium]|nr:hypothetical protein [Myxococcales bacterium]
MHRIGLGLLTVLFASCVSENQIGEDLLPPQEVNPPELDNPVTEDRIVQSTPPVADITWVIDNSCSMSCVVGCHSGGSSSLADKITENFGVFMQYFEGGGIDYHIGVVTTDMDQPADSGRLQLAAGYKYIDANTVNQVQVFGQMARQGTGGSGNEKGLDALHISYEDQGNDYNAGYWRDGSALHTVTLANEDDASSISRDEFVGWYGGLRETDNRTYSVIACTEVSKQCRETSDKYISAAHEIGGFVASVDTENWVPLLDGLGAQAAGLRREYYLSEMPDRDTIRVEVELFDGGLNEFFESPSGEVEDGDWVYSESRNSITFLDYMPPSASVVVIRYEPRSAQVDVDSAVSR